MVDSMIRIGYYANYGLLFIELLEEFHVSKFALGWLLGLCNVCGIIVGKHSPDCTLARSIHHKASLTPHEEFLDIQYTYSRICQLHFYTRTMLQFHVIGSDFLLSGHFT